MTDASNLQLGLRPSMLSEHPALDHRDVPLLLSRQDALAKFLGGSQLSTKALFDAGAFDGAVSAVRGTPGVRSTGVRSTAIGGTSVMTVSYAGSITQLAEALRARGFTVRQGSNALAISR